MANARINLKNIDYFKFKKFIIDGNRDDYSTCSKEVQLLCDCVQTINFRDEEFDDEMDRERFNEICSIYKQILGSKRIDPTDMKIKSGWWGDHKNAYSAGKLKATVLKSTLISKAKDWVTQHAGCALKSEQIDERISGPGLFVFKHKEHQCFQYVARANNIYAACAEKLKAAFEASVTEPIAALVAINMASDWDFYFLPVEDADDDRMLRILENDFILQHDSIWPHGLNVSLHIDSLLEVSQFRKSCIRHNWPPTDDAVDDVINLQTLRHKLEGHDLHTEVKLSLEKTSRSNTASDMSGSVSESSLKSNKKVLDKPLVNRAGGKSYTCLTGKREVNQPARVTRSSNLTSPRPITADKKVSRQTRPAPASKGRHVSNLNTADNKNSPSKSSGERIGGTPKKKTTRNAHQTSGDESTSDASSHRGSPSAVSPRKEHPRCPSPDDEPIKDGYVEQLCTSSPQGATPSDLTQDLPATEPTAIETVNTSGEEEPLATLAIVEGETIVDTDITSIHVRRASNTSISSGGTWTIEECDNDDAIHNIPVIDQNDEL